MQTMTYLQDRGYDMTKLNTTTNEMLATALAALPVRPGRSSQPGTMIALPAENTPARRVYDALCDQGTLLASYGTRAGTGTHAMFKVWLSALCAQLANGEAADKLTGVRDRDMAASIGSVEYGPNRPTGPHNGTMTRNGRVSKTAIGYSLAGPIVQIVSQLIAAESETKPAAEAPKGKAKGKKVPEVATA
jgi:hypothetical protein